MSSRRSIQRGCCLPKIWYRGRWIRLPQKLRKTKTISVCSTTRTWLALLAAPIVYSNESRRCSETDARILAKGKRESLHQNLLSPYAGRQLGQGSRKTAVILAPQMVGTAVIIGMTGPLGRCPALSRNSLVESLAGPICSCTQLD